MEGRFRTGLVQGHTRLLDPQGSPFFALGVNHTGEIACFGADELFRRRYRSEWRVYCDEAERRLRDWGFNCCGYATPPGLQDKMPFFQAVQTLGNPNFAKD